MARTTIDIDTGGTFTDGFVIRDGTPYTVKTLTTPHDLAVCFQNVIEAAAAALGMTVTDMLRETVSVRYATTVGTNTVIQRKGPRLGLLSAAAAELGANAGVGLFVRPDMVAEIPRSDPNGNGEANASVPLAAMRQLLSSGARGLVAAAPGTFAEQRIRDAFTEHYPRQCLDTVPLLLAGEVTDDENDARRTATALFNAYVHPDVADYLYRAEDYLRDHGYHRPLRIVHNDGGAARVAKTIAGKTYNSGPMAGLLGASAVARHYGLASIVTLDMGGTSLDVGIIRDGEVPMLEHGHIEDVEVAFRLPDLVPFGVGGGSIAWMDGETLRVGPQSAGAKPGPACFGFGGTDPTVTDADVVLGLLRPAEFLGGTMELDVDAAFSALRPIADALACTVTQAAQQVRAQVHRDAGERLARELRARGVQPASTAVLAFGGNGPTHCAGIAQAAGIAEVLILPFAPVFSAFGASTTDIRHRHEARADTHEEAALRERAVRDMRGEGVAADEVSIEVRRYDSDGHAWIAVEASHRLPHADLGALATPPAAGGFRGSTVDACWPGVGSLPTVVHQQAAVPAGHPVNGPALIDSFATTCAVPPGWIFTVDEQGAARVRYEQKD